jgi:hypothetical protein
MERRESLSLRTPQPDEPNSRTAEGIDQSIVVELPPEVKAILFELATKYYQTARRADQTITISDALDVIQSIYFEMVLHHPDSEVVIAAARNTNSKPKDFKLGIENIVKVGQQLRASKITRYAELKSKILIHTNPYGIEADLLEQARVELNRKLRQPSFPQSEALVHLFDSRTPLLHAVSNQLLRKILKQAQFSAESEQDHILREPEKQAKTVRGILFALLAMRLANDRTVNPLFISEASLRATADYLPESVDHPVIDEVILLIIGQLQLDDQVDGSQEARVLLRFYCKQIVDYIGNWKKHIASKQHSAADIRYWDNFSRSMGWLFPIEAEIGQANFVTSAVALSATLSQEQPSTVTEHIWNKGIDRTPHGYVPTLESFRRAKALYGVSFASSAELKNNPAAARVVDGYTVANNYHKNRSALASRIAQKTSLKQRTTKSLDLAREKYIAQNPDQEELAISGIEGDMLVSELTSDNLNAKLRSTEGELAAQNHAKREQSRLRKEFPSLTRRTRAVTENTKRIAWIETSLSEQAQKATDSFKRKLIKLCATSGDVPPTRHALTHLQSRFAAVSDRLQQLDVHQWFAQIGSASQDELLEVPFVRAMIIEIAALQEYYSKANTMMILHQVVAQDGIEQPPGLLLRNSHESYTTVEILNVKGLKSVLRAKLQAFLNLYERASSQLTEILETNTVVAECTKFEVSGEVGPKLSKKLRNDRQSLPDFFEAAAVAVISDADASMLTDQQLAAGTRLLRLFGPYGERTNLIKMDKSIPTTLLNVNRFLQTGSLEEIQKDILYDAFRAFLDADVVPYGLMVGTNFNIVIKGLKTRVRYAILKKDPEQLAEKMRQLRTEKKIRMGTEQRTDMQLTIDNCTKAIADAEAKIIEIEQQYEDAMRKMQFFLTEEQAQQLGILDTVESQSDPIHT